MIGKVTVEMENGKVRVIRHATEKLTKEDLHNLENCINKILQKIKDDNVQRN